MRRLLHSAAALAATVACAGICAAPALASRPAKPARAAARLYLYDVFFLHHATVDVPRRAITVKGYVSSGAPGQHLTLEAFLGRRRVLLRRLAIHPTRTGRAGTFTTTLTAPEAGTLHLAVYHRATAALARFHATRAVDVLPESTGSGPYVALVQQRLAALHFYLPQSGHWDLQTELAIEAYHRLLGRGTSATLDPATLSSLLDGQGRFTVRYPHDGRHVEGDLSDQLLALVDGSQVAAIYPISSGKPSTPTIEGRFEVYRRTPGYLPDGMYYSDFFIRGYAVHGYDPAPDYPASHGCMRLPISDAISVFDWLALGDRVDVYGTPTGSV